jgi:hypothetical protein
MGRTYRTVEGFDAKKHQRELKKVQKRAEKARKKQIRKDQQEESNEM